MIIDMHTHIFPEKIAERTLDTLAKTFHSDPFTKGTADSLAESAEKAGIDLSVIYLWLQNQVSLNQSHVLQNNSAVNRYILLVEFTLQVKIIKKNCII